MLKGLAGSCQRVGAQDRSGFPWHRLTDGIYKHLHNDVLKPCVLEINKNSDISVGYRGIKKGRAVADLLFMVERTAMQMPLAGPRLSLLAVRASRQYQAGIATR